MKPTLPLALLLLLAGCGGKPVPMVYVALDEQFSKPLLAEFATGLGLEVRTRFDSEAAKTVGLVSALRDEHKHPLASVFWNNELAHTVALADEGLLEPYDSPAAQDLPAEWRDPQHRWSAFAARARILAVNTELLPDPKAWPRSVQDLVDPKWKGRCAVAKPVNGTTLTHFTALKKALGDAGFDAFWQGLVKNDVVWVPGNGAAVRAVIEGKVAFALTDTDDYHVARQNGQKIACVFPDQQEGGLGTLLIPNSVALVKGGPDPEGSKRLIDKILARQTEALLAAAESAQIPLRAGVPGPKDPAILPVGKFRPMPWDVAWTAANLTRCHADFSKRLGL